MKVGSEERMKMGQTGLVYICLAADKNSGFSGRFGGLEHRFENDRTQIRSYRNPSLN